MVVLGQRYSGGDHVAIANGTDLFDTVFFGQAMDIEFLARILASFVVLHTVHDFGEVSNVRAKVAKLKATIDGTL